MRKLAKIVLIVGLVLNAIFFACLFFIPSTLHVLNPLICAPESNLVVEASPHYDRNVLFACVDTLGNPKDATVRLFSGFIKYVAFPYLVILALMTVLSRLPMRKPTNP